MTQGQNNTSGLSSPPASALPITPHDLLDLPVVLRGLMVRTAGDVEITTVTGDTITLPALVPGVQYAIRARRIHATNTTATGIIGLA